MSTSFQISSSIRGYGVIVACGAARQLHGRYSNAVLMCDTALCASFSAQYDKHVPIVAKESGKNLEGMPEIFEQLRQLGANRQSTLVALGGGVIQDIATFSASLYMRGIRWVYVPTTLLGMVDSCIGGKSSINVGHHKNLVGNFYPPEQVVVDPELLETLPQAQRVAGLCEAVKICFARDDESFSRYLSLSPSPEMPIGQFEAVIETSLLAKKFFIETDEFDRSERLLLNFGHTFGHALEAASGFALSHGIAVGLGMIAAVRLSDSLGRQASSNPKVGKLIDHLLFLLSRITGLQETVRRIDARAAFGKFKSDKKHGSSQFMVIAVDRQGKLERVLLERNEANERLIEQAFRSLANYQTASETALAKQ